MSGLKVLMSDRRRLIIALSIVVDGGPVLK